MWPGPEENKVNEIFRMECNLYSWSEKCLSKQKISSFYTLNTFKERYSISKVRFLYAILPIMSFYGVKKAWNEEPSALPPSSLCIPDLLYWMIWYIRPLLWKFQYGEVVGKFFGVFSKFEVVVLFICFGCYILSMYFYVFLQNKQRSLYFNV